MCERDTFVGALSLQCLNLDLLPCITAVFSNCLDSGVFPSDYKFSLVKPLLKKLFLVPNDSLNYSPALVPNVCVQHVVPIDSPRIVVSQLNEHPNSNNPPALSTESAYRPSYSPETVVLSGSLTTS